MRLDINKKNLFLVISGYKYIIQGVHGECGGNVVKTDMFRVITQDKDGNEVTSENEANFVNRMK